MSVTASPPGASAAAPPSPAPAADACPLCGGPLHLEQEWCLRCGAAARTRLAAAPDWKAPLATFAVVIALSLGVLAAALVKLAGDSGPAITRTTTVTGPAATTALVPSTTTPGTGAPGAAGAGGALPGAATTTSTPSTTVPGTGAGATSTPGAASGRPTTSSGATTTPSGVVPGVGAGITNRLRKQGTNSVRQGK
jgi:hypothetical protein